MTLPNARVNHAADAKLRLPKPNPTHKILHIITLLQLLLRDQVVVVEERDGDGRKRGVGSRRSGKRVGGVGGEPGGLRRKLANVSRRACSLKSAFR